MGGRRSIGWLLGLLVALVGFVLLGLSRRPPQAHSAAVASTREPARRAPAGAPEAPARPVPRIAGRVRFGRAPFAGALVHVFPGDATTLSGSDGRFDLGAVVVRDSLVVAEAPDKRAAAAWVPASSTGATIELVLGACAMRVVGTVRDAAGKPIARPLVRVLQRAGMAARFGHELETVGLATGDDAGHYEVCVNLGTRRIEARAAGRAAADEEITIEAGARRDFVLGAEAVLAGRAVTDEDGAGLAGAVVTAVPTDANRRLPRVALSDESGGFRVGELAPGGYRVSCAAPGRYLVGAPQVVTTGAVSALECRLHRGRTIAGQVLERDHGAAGATVLTQLGEATFTADPADELGRFVLDGVPEGALELRIVDAEVVEPPLLPEAGDAGGVVVRIAGRTSVAGRVLLRGRPVAGALVEVLTTNPVRRATTDGGGSYRFVGLPAGQHALRATSDALLATEDGEVTLDAGEAKTGVDIELSSLAAISGTVVDESGAGVAGVAVHFDDGVDEGTAVSGPGGAFQVAYLDGGGTYKAGVSIDGFAALPLKELPEVKLEEGERVAGILLAIRPPRFSVTGTVLSSEGLPSSGVYVAADTGLGFSTGADGRFEVRGLPAGSVRLTARSETSFGHADVTAGDTDVRIVVSPTVAVTGTLQGFGQVRRVSLFFDPGGWRDVRPAGDTFVFASLPTGPATALVAGTEGLDIEPVEVVPNMAPLALHGRADVLTVGVITEDGSPLPSGIACTQSVHTTQFDDWIGARPLDRENKVRVLRSGFVDRITCGAPGQQGNLEISPGSAPSNLVVVVRRK